MDRLPLVVLSKVALQITIVILDMYLLEQAKEDAHLLIVSGLAMYQSAEVIECDFSSVIDCMCTYVMYPSVVDCGSPGRLANGVSNFTSTTFGSMVMHRCDEGFILCGMETRTCQPNSMWSDSLPDCVSK